MYELRVVALSEDARYVVLAPVLEGRRERYRVAVDDRLRAALRGELGRLERKIRPDSALTPREIQARVRAGETAETIAAAAGVAVEWVLRFETPVLAERALVARQARHASLSVSGGEWTGVPLEEIVAARLEADGNRPEVADWDAWRRDDGRWVLQLRVGTFSAHWLWDPALARLVVHDEAARALLHPDDSSGEPTLHVSEPRRLTLARVPQDAADSPESVEPFEPEVLVELRSEAADSSDGSADPVDAEATHQVSTEAAEHPAASASDAAPDRSADLSPALSAELAEPPPAAGAEPPLASGAEPPLASGAESAPAESDPAARPDELIDPVGNAALPAAPADPPADLPALPVDPHTAAEDAPDPYATEGADAVPEASPADPARGPRRSGRRKSVPSWEDILLGTGADPSSGTRSG